MRILFLSRYQFPYVRSGGTGVVVYELMKEMKNLGHHIEHWTWDSKFESKDLKVENMVGFSPLTHVDTSDIKFRNFFDIYLHNLAMIERLKSTEPFDVIHVHTWELYLAGIFAKFLWNVPLVFTTHDVMQDDLPSEVLEPDIYLHNVFGERNIAAEADAISAVSADNRDLFCKYYPEAYAKTHVIPNGVDIEVFRKKDSKEVFRKHNINITEPYVLFLGRAVKQKGIENIIRAFELMEEDIPIVFALSLTRWDGEKHLTSDQYVEMIQRLMSKKKNVYLLMNEWDRDRVVELYSHAIFTLLPSIYEPGAITPFETQACSTPIVTNNIGIMKTCVQNGVTGVVLELDDDREKYSRKLADTILKLYHNPELVNSMRDNARKYIVENHTWTHRAIAHLRLYESLIDQKSRPLQQSLA
jgi:alpha-maltose-1-phosphate synthase